MADVSGQRTTLNTLQATRRVDMYPDILLLEPESAPLTVFSNKAASRPCVNPEYSWVEDELRNRFDAINDASPPAAADTVLTVDDGTKFAANDLVKVTRTGEVMRVVSISTNDVTVVRAVGATAAADFLDNDELYIVGSSFAEGTAAPTSLTDNPAQVKNYTQIFKTTWELTGTQLAQELFVRTTDWAHQARKVGIEHAKDIELSYLFGEKGETTVSGKPIRNTGGIYEFIDTNITDVGGVMDESEWWNALRPAFRYGKKTKLGLASQVAVDVLSAYARSKVQVVDQARNAYGVKIIELNSPHGTLMLATHYLLEGAYAGDVIILDMDQVAARYLAGNGVNRSTHINKEIQAPGTDSRQDEFLSEVGLQFGLEKCHALVSGITA